MLQSPTTVRLRDDGKEEFRLPALPLDIWIQIATSLADLRDVLQLRSVCHDLKNAIEHCHPIWTELDFNYCDDIIKRKFPPTEKDLVMSLPFWYDLRGHSFLSCLPSQAIKRIKWRPKDSTEAEEIIRFVFEKFSSIEELDIRPYLGDATSTYIEVIEQVLNQLAQQQTRCCKLEQLLISHTSFRHERVALFTTETRMIKKIDQHLQSIIGQNNESKTESKHHDVAILPVWFVLARFLQCACLARIIARYVTVKSVPIVLMRKNRA
ncbi:hypothetical protein INT43_001809 [Umbelopsis isabellina]|uniref:F-box domain-containing protein n=1 Tax=Mortierella isabellina TaxID=91625 RepID=A0A8H7PRI5_MORIS|nr:hypothetical protein INT43_001809 [Umbelopsis isabellina]